MKLLRSGMALGAALVLGGCAGFGHLFCAPSCTTQTRNSSSLVAFLYPDGKLPAPSQAIPELRVPLRVGLAFLPPQPAYGGVQLDDAHKQELLERIRKRFLDRKFVTDIVVIPDYYLTGTRGFSGLDGLQRLYSIDVMALVSYDQVTHSDENRKSLAYLTIIGAYFIPGTSHDTTTLVDLAVVDPATRALVLRAGGTDSRASDSALVKADRDLRVEASQGFDAATDRMITNFDAALTHFEAAVHDGKAAIRVVDRNNPAGGGGAFGGLDLGAMFVFAAMNHRARRARRGRN